MFRSTPSCSRRKRGQSLVEFALVLPIIIALLLGIMEFGWMTKNKLTVDNAARAGARTAALGRPTSQVQSVIESQTSGVPGSPQNLTITMKRDDDNASNGYHYNIALGNKPADSSGVVKNDAPSGAMIQVTVSIPNQSLTGFFPFLNNRTIETSVAMRRE